MTTVIREIRGFVHTHDDVPAFHAAYLVATFLAAAIFPLSFFAILVALHMCLDYVKYRDLYKFSISVTFRAILLESVVDIALILVSLTFAVYLSHDFMLVAVSGILRSSLTILRAGGTIIPKIRILENALTIVTGIHVYLHTIESNLDKPMSRAQLVSLTTIGICSLLLAYSIVLYQDSSSTLWSVVLREFSLTI